MRASTTQYRSSTADCRHEDRGSLLLWQLLKLQAWIDAHLGEYISSQQLADCVRLSRYHFARVFRRSTGMSPQRYVVCCRLERAQDLMLWTDMTLSRIAFECGFCDHSHFSRTFLKALGEAPRAWRRTRKARERGGLEISAPRMESPVGRHHRLSSNPRAAIRSFVACPSVNCAYTGRSADSAAP